MHIYFLFNKKIKDRKNVTEDVFKEIMAEKLI